MPAPGKIACYGGPLDGKEIYYNEGPILKCREDGDRIPVCEGELEGLYIVPKDDPLRLVYVGPL